mmetsp:Transcript_34195/g.73030  ORF Transcript_34195/g.73030 Transcript_34195/m.73030 type:complete len:221 (+) Transcript_34195:1386-2048(+)
MLSTSGACRKLPTTKPRSSVSSTTRYQGSTRPCSTSGCSFRCSAGTSRTTTCTLSPTFTRGRPRRGTASPPRTPTSSTASSLITRSRRPLRTTPCSSSRNPPCCRLRCSSIRAFPSAAPHKSLGSLWSPYLRPTTLASPTASTRPRRLTSCCPTGCRTHEPRRPGTNASAASRASTSSRYSSAQPKLTTLPRSCTASIRWSSRSSSTARACEREELRSGQ